MVKNKFALVCGHTFCRDCWRYHLEARLNEGINNCSARCMQDGCNCVVTHSAFLELLDSAGQEHYWNNFCKTYTSEDRSIRWCSSNKCENCFKRSEFSTTPVVSCKCGQETCLHCGNESHQPAYCNVVEKWNIKSNAESENLLWIKANTKSCPKCARPIEKNQGCNHMTCRGCHYEFCWVCTGCWKDHGSSTGGYYKCNIFEEKLKSDKNLADAEKQRNLHKSALARYTHYYERYANHDKSVKFAKNLLPTIQQKIELLNTVKNYPVAELTFLIDACQEVIKCSRVLKWTYAYGYYCTSNLNMIHKEQFEFSQKDLERHCDILMKMVETPLDKFLDPNIVERSPFYNFKDELVSYFSTIKKYH